MRTMLAALMICAASPTSAGMTIGELNETCIEDEKSTLGGLCVMYIVGFLEGTMLVTLLKEGETGENFGGYCLPEEVDHGQSIAVVKKWLRDNPEMWHHPAGFSIIVAMQKAFPCPDYL